MEKVIRRGWFCWVLALFLAGCGDGRPSLVQATGTITLDGNPIEGAVIALQPVGEGEDANRRPSAGVTGPDGKFTLTTYEKDDGVPPGKYKVTVQKRELIGKLPANYNDERPDAVPLKYKLAIPRKYMMVETSGLEVEVTSSELKPATFDLQTGGEKPEIESTGPGRRGNEP